MQKKLIESVTPWLNLRIIVRRKGKIVSVRDTHNVLTRQGKNWLRGRYGAAQYPISEPPGGIYPGESGDWTVEQAKGLTMNMYPIRYVGFGAGGIYNGGAFSESSHVASLETPLQIDNEVTPRWLKQVLPQADPEDLTTFPDDTEICFHTILEGADISFLAEQTISEVICCTALADPFSKPDLATHPEGVPGVVAYNCFTGIPKGVDDTQIELLWYWR